MTTTRQHALPSGFTDRSTASDVLEGIDLAGKTAIVTGGYSGLGIETVAALSDAGAHVVVPARRPEVARQALDERGLSEVEVDTLDLSDLASVRTFAERFLASGRSLDILINNAAIMASPEARVGDGWEAQFATNHLGHYVLTNLLWPALVADGGARVVALSSTGHKLSPMRFDEREDQAQPGRGATQRRRG
jgi:NAD(P)-dependent dehydrogenase (short-subunit alcohol dehydrogenase family)